MIHTTIDNFYLDDEQLANTPTIQDGVDPEKETLLRVYGCELIQEGGILLRLKQVVMATGQVIFHRFYCKQSMKRFNVKDMAMACTWLAAKLEEYPCRIRDVLNVFHRMHQRRSGALLEPLEMFSERYDRMKSDLVKAERHLLKEMGFIAHVEHPHKFVLNYLQLLHGSTDLMREAWCLVNDRWAKTVWKKSEAVYCHALSFLVVACGIIYLAARRLQVPLPEDPPWWLLFNVTLPQIVEVCRVITNMYTLPKATYIPLVPEGTVLSSQFLHKDAAGGRSPLESKPTPPPSPSVPSPLAAAPGGGMIKKDSGGTRSGLGVESGMAVAGEDGRAENTAPGGGRMAPVPRNGGNRGSSTLERTGHWRVPPRP
eukprot:jgi/Mesvir1/21736/Mv04146-RA.1